MYFANCHILLICSVMKLTFLLLVTGISFVEEFKRILAWKYAKHYDLQVYLTVESLSIF
jgi:hypothetical protein